MEKWNIERKLENQMQKLKLLKTKIISNVMLWGRLSLINYQLEKIA